MSKWEKYGDLPRGGFATAAIYRNKDDGKEIVIKTLYRTDEISISRFKKEINILSKLDHPNVIKIIRAKLDGEPYMYTMHRYRTSLTDLLPSILAQNERITSIFGRILDGIEYAHKEGVLHRDLTPNNILINDDSDVVVTDFGLARELDSTSERQTKTGVPLGTPDFMSPEQRADAKNVDVRSDIYSLGRILYVMHKGWLVGAVQDLSGLPAAMHVIVDRCTRTKPDERFQNIDELKNAWKSITEEIDVLEELSEFTAISDKLATDDIFEAQTIERTIQILSCHIEDGPMVHDFIMKVQDKAIMKLYEKDSRFMVVLIQAFADHTGSQSWNFSYTDRIGAKCKGIYDLIDNPMIRTVLIRCLMEVGFHHNRFFVIGLLQSILYSISDVAESLSVVEEIKRLSPYIKSMLLDTVDTNKIRSSVLKKFLLDAISVS